jgi:hypothetical protein
MTTVIENRGSFIKMVIEPNDLRTSACETTVLYAQIAGFNGALSHFRDAKVKGRTGSYPRFILLHLLNPVPQIAVVNFRDSSPCNHVLLDGAIGKPTDRE